MRKILMLFTGGTIASLKTDAGLEPVLDAEQILSYLPDMREDIVLDSLEVCNLDSTNMNYHIWLELAEKIEKKYEKYDGFVICHGTDTMAYTAAALSYLVQDSPKPIVLTGSQQPIQMEITDAIKNLYDSIIYAADKASRGVTLIFDGKVIAGTRAKKTKSFSYHAFSSINFPELASMQHGKIVRYIPGEPFASREKKESAKEGTFAKTNLAAGKTTAEGVKFYHRMNPRVYAMKLTPGMSPVLLEAVFQEYDCIVVESFGVGGMPDSIIEDFSRLMKQYQEGSKVVIMTTQVTYEGSNLSTYEVGQRIQKRFPYLEAYDMNFEAVFTKIMWIMGLGALSFQKIEQLFYKKINYDVLVYGD